MLDTDTKIEMTVEEMLDLKARFTAAAQRHFRTFGGGDPMNRAEWNPLAHALKDKPVQFAAGVDVGEVFRLFCAVLTQESMSKAGTLDDAVEALKAEREI